MYNTLLYMFQQLCTYFQDAGVLIFGGGGGYVHVLSGHCSRQQISVIYEGYLFLEGYLFTGILLFFSTEKRNLKNDFGLAARNRLSLSLPLSLSSLSYFLSFSKQKRIEK